VCNRWLGEKPAVPERNAAPKRNPLRSEPRATLGASAGEHFAAGRSRHACAEAVRALAVQIAGLKCSFHADALRARKFLLKQKDVRRLGSRALYAPRRRAVNRAPIDSLLTSLWITGAQAY
jgi:hypothetical protein